MADALAWFLEARPKIIRMSADHIADPHEQNRRSWNAVTAAHNSHKQNQAEFLRRGGSTLFPEELELLGDPSGRRLVHLQCNCGQDSLSLAALGAKVTGVDISDEAIGFARRLSRESGIPARFIRSDLFDWFDADSEAGERFELAFSTYGTIGWLRDLDRWARGVFTRLAPGGRLVLLEFHPLAFSFDASGRVIEPYFHAAPLQEEQGVSDYVARSGDGLTPMGRTPDAQEAPAFKNPEPSVAYPWTLAETVSSVARAGLLIEVVREYPYANGCQLFEGLRDLGQRRYGMPESVPLVPLMFGLTARRPEAPP